MPQKITASPGAITSGTVLPAAARISERVGRGGASLRIERIAPTNVAPPARAVQTRGRGRSPERGREPAPQRAAELARGVHGPAQPLDEPDGLDAQPGAEGVE